MFKLSEADHAVQQIDECGAMIGISRQWYEEAKQLLNDYESTELTPEQIITLISDYEKMSIIATEFRKL